MENLIITQFSPKSIELLSPKRSEIMALAEEGKKLTIRDINDKEGYEKVHEVRMKLVKARTSVRKDGLKIREDAKEFQKAIIKLEDEIVELGEPTEKELEYKEQVIDEQKEKLKRVKSLPDRRTKLAAIQVTVDDDFILLQDDEQFQAFLNQETGRYLVLQQEKLAAETQRLEDEKRKLQEAKDLEEREKQRAIEQAKAVKEAEEKAKAQALVDAEKAKERAEAEKLAAVEAERQKAEKEKQRLIDEQAQKERERVEKENAERLVAEQKAEAEKQEELRVEKLKKYQKFLDKHGYSDETKGDFYTQRNGNTITLFKKVGEISI